MRKVSRAERLESLKLLNKIFGKGKPVISRRYDEDDWDEEEFEYDPKFVQWTTSDGSMFLPAARTVQVLPPGVYEVDSSTTTGLFFEKIDVKTEGLIRFPDTNSNRVVDEIKKFWEKEQIFREYNLVYKRGIILFGPPGSGKSCTVQLVMEDVVDRGGIVMQFWEPNIFLEGLRALRKIQPETPVVAVMEDLDSLVENYHESEILNILDGVNNVDRVVFLATTNYPNKLGHRILNRPSRFDKRFRIGFPSQKSRRMYFEHLIGEEKIEELNIDLDRWVKDTKQFSIAHLKELFVAVVILGDDYKEAVKTLKQMKEEVNDKDYEGYFGFHNKEDEDEEDDV
jgi:AAA+ superfamily predicted ATPase